MLHIKLGNRRPAAQPDPLERQWVGYDPFVPVEELFSINRGTWVMGPRAKNERYAVFSYTGDHRVKFVAEIDRVRPDRFGERKVLEGRVLDAAHPVARRWIGREAPDHSRNPVTYFEDSDGERRMCQCGQCTEEAPIGRAFAPGHDQKAIHARIAGQWGDTLGFIRWFDATYGAPA